MMVPWKAVFVQVLDPAAFGGTADFERQMDWLAKACRDATPGPEPIARATLSGLDRPRARGCRHHDLVAGVF